MCATWRSAPPCLKRRQTKIGTRPSLNCWRKKKEEFARRLEETYGASREDNAEYRKTGEDWERRAMAEFRSMKNRKTARKAVTWGVGLAVSVLAAIVIIAAILTL